jgi:hypothetical protein
MIYRLYYIGGPHDGEEVISPRPYDATEYRGEVYAATEEGDDCLEWVDDNTRRITLHYLGRGIPFPPESRPESPR